MRISRAAGREAAVAGEGERAGGSVRGNIAKPAAVGSGSSHSQAPRPFASPTDVFERVDDKGVANKGKPSPRRSKPSPDRQGFLRADSSSSGTASGRRKSTGSDRPPQQEAPPLFPLERGGGGVERMSRNLSLLEIQRGDRATTGKGGPGGGRAYGTTPSMQQRTRQAIGNMTYRRESMPVGLTAGKPVSGRSTAASPPGIQANGTASPAAAAREEAPGSITASDVWEEISAAGEGGRGGVGWGFGGRTQGDLLLQQRARGPSRPYH